MELIYRINNREIREAFWLNFWNWPRRIFVAFMAILLVADLYWIALIVQDEKGAGMSATQALKSDDAFTFLVVLGVLVFVFSYWLLFLPWRAVRLFHKIPGSTGDLLATATPEYFEVRIGGSAISHLEWKFYKLWREGKCVFILKIHSGQYQLLPKSALSPAELVELRVILTSALPSK